MVGEPSTSIDKMIQKVEKIEKYEVGELTRSEKEETNKIKNNNSTEINKIQNRNKTINVISSKIDKQIFFDVIDKIDDEERNK